MLNPAMLPKMLIMSCPMSFLHIISSHQSITYANQVVAQLLDGVCGHTGLNRLGIVREEDGHLRLDNDHAGLAL